MYGVAVEGGALPGRFIIYQICVLENSVALQPCPLAAFTGAEDNPLGDI
jgi:hypothetical protein